MLVALGVLWLPLHFRLTKGDLEQLWAWMSSVQEVRVAEEMAKLRERNCKAFCRCLCHVSLGNLFFHSYLFLSEASLDNFSKAVSTLVFYMVVLLIRKDVVRLSGLRLKLVACFMHLIPVLLISGVLLSKNHLLLSEMMRGFLAGHFCLILIFLDPSISCPFQLLFAALDVYVAVVVSQHEVGEVCSNQLLILAETLGSSFFIDLTLKSRIEAQIRHKDSDSLVSSFRRMLRGVCDGEVLLDSDLKVAVESEGLKHLLMADVPLQGRAFESWTEDPIAFQDFLKRPAHRAPAGHRMSLRGANGIRVSTDVFHVPVPMGSGEHHLLAFIEDNEAPAPDAEVDALPGELLERPRRSAGSLPGSSAGSSVHSSVASCGGLQDMTLLVDLQAYSVEEAHLRFQQEESSMVSLRKLLKATNWERIRQNLDSFAKQARERPEIQPWVIHKLPLRLLGSRCHAEEALLRPFRGLVAVSGT